MSRHGFAGIDRVFLSVGFQVQALTQGSGVTLPHPRHDQPVRSGGIEETTERTMKFVGADAHFSRLPDQRTEDYITGQFG